MKPGNPKCERIFEAAWKQSGRRWPKSKLGTDKYALDKAFRYCFMEGVRYTLKKI